MEGDKRDGGLEVADDLFKGHEGVFVSFVEIDLVDFIGEKDETVFLAKADQLNLGLVVEESSGGVAWVDDNKGFRFGTISNGFLDGRFHFGW